RRVVHRDLRSFPTRRSSDLMLKKKESATIWPEIHEWIARHVDPKMLHKVFATGGNINKVHKLLGKQFMEPVSFRELDELYDKLKDRKSTRLNSSHVKISYAV